MTCDYDPTDNPFLPAEERAEHAPHAEGSVYVWQRRPSNPQDLCAILLLCERCATECGWDSQPCLPGDEVPAIGTLDQVTAWAEAHGGSHGIAWVS